MLVKGWFQWLFIAALAGIFILLVMWTLPVHAQCEKPPSSCITCHAKQSPVYENGVWHIIHGRKDICANCHGGNYITDNKELAHEGLVSNPLSDIYTSCHQCHSDYIVRAARFAVILRVTPSSSATSTPAPFTLVTGGSGPAEIVFSSDFVTVPPPQSFSIIVIGFATLVFFGLALHWLDKHRIQN
jgi:hypothetical protein